MDKTFHSTSPPKMIALRLNAQNMIVLLQIKFYLNAWIQLDTLEGSAHSLAQQLPTSQHKEIFFST